MAFEAKRKDADIKASEKAHVEYQEVAKELGELEEIQQAIFREGVASTAGKSYSASSATRGGKLKAGEWLAAALKSDPRHPKHREFKMAISSGSGIGMRSPQPTRRRSSSTG
jgi:hypothetical protein